MLLDVQFKNKFWVCPSFDLTSLEVISNIVEMIRTLPIKNKTRKCVNLTWGGVGVLEQKQQKIQIFINLLREGFKKNKKKN